jgi:hypothetical protein
MEPSTQQSLTDILNSFDANQDATKKETTRRNSEHKAFLEQFTAKAKSTIRPAMEAVGELLKTRGHDYEIRERGETREDDGRRHVALIEFRVYPKGQRPSYSDENHCPHVAFAAEGKNNVLVYESTMMPNRGGSAGGAGEYDLQKVTAAVVEKHIVAVLEKSFKG